MLVKSTGQAAVGHLIGMIAEELTSFAKVALNLAVAFEKPAALIEFGPVVMVVEQPLMIELSAVAEMTLMQNFVAN